ncbi:MAG: N-acetylmuramoyl-L-alanine amidase, partial [Bacteroidota bacterium]|nr:N-acetylmuramoyl-L-alanine amidase [Bacteroidota bacterium]
MSSRFFVLLVGGLIFFIVSCSRPPYYQTNKSYQKQAKQYAKTIEQPPSIFEVAQSPSTYWVGTTNFNMRKPNYV